MRLSARGRQRFGEFVANGLLGAAALVGSSILVPGALAAAEIPEGLLSGAIVAFALSVAGGLFVRYITEEREGERT
jgi:hypothetical protein